MIALSIEELARVLAVGADAADHGSQVDDDLGLGLAEQPPDGILFAQVVDGTSRDEDGRRFELSKLPAHRAAQETRPAGHHQTPTPKKTHGCLLSFKWIVLDPTVRRGFFVTNGKRHKPEAPAKGGPGSFAGASGLCRTPKFTRNPRFTVGC